MKILFVTYHGLGFGGAEVSTKYLAEGLKQLGHEIIFVSNGHYDGFQNFKLRAYQKIPLFFIHNVYMRSKLRGIIAREKPDLIHVHDRLTSVPAIQIARDCHIPVVVHFRDYWFACPNSSCMARDGFAYDECSTGIIFKHFPMKRWLWDLYKLRYIKKARGILNKADLKIANSNAVKRRLEICGIQRAEVVNILRDLSKFSGKVERGVIKKRFGLKKNVITYVGGFTRVKGILFALDVVAEVIRDKDEWCFFIAGHGDLEDEMRRFVNQKGLNDKIIIAGKLGIEDMPYVYADSDIIVLPSLWDEPLSGILLEAGASGKAMICSDRGGNKEVMVHGENGLIVKAGDKESWKRALITLIKNPGLRTKIGEKAKEIIARKFSIEIVAEEVEHCYLGLIRRG